MLEFETETISSSRSMTLSYSSGRGESLPSFGVRHFVDDVLILYSWVKV